MALGGVAGTPTLSELIAAPSPEAPAAPMVEAPLGGGTGGLTFQQLFTLAQDPSMPMENRRQLQMLLYQIYKSGKDSGFLGMKEGASGSEQAQMLQRVLSRPEYSWLGSAFQPQGEGPGNFQIISESTPGLGWYAGLEGTPNWTGPTPRPDIEPSSAEQSQTSPFRAAPQLPIETPFATPRGMETGTTTTAPTPIVSSPIGSPKWLEEQYRKLKYGQVDLSVQPQQRSLGVADIGQDVVGAMNLTSLAGLG